MSALAPRPASCKYDRSGDSQEIRPIVSHIHQLPTELLVKIFVHCIPPNVMFIYSSHPPLLLARICSHWRTVALGTPCLWRYIPYSSFAKSPGKWERQASLAKLFLSRSAECPLSIRVSLCCLTSTNDHCTRCADSAWAPLGGCLALHTGVVVQILRATRRKVISTSKT
jgi:hypothetical protein